MFQLSALDDDSLMENAVSDIDLEVSLDVTQQLGERGKLSHFLMERVHDIFEPVFFLINCVSQTRCFALEDDPVLRPIIQLIEIDDCLERINVQRSRSANFHGIANSHPNVPNIMLRKHCSECFIDTNLYVCHFSSSTLGNTEQAKKNF